VIISGSTPELDVFRVFLLGGTGGCLDILDLCQAINAEAERLSAGLREESKAQKGSIKRGRLETLSRLRTSRIKVEGILDDRLFASHVRYVEDIPVCGGFDCISRTDPNFFFVTALGNAHNFRNRVSLLKSFELSPDRFVSLVHPSSFVADSAHIGLGCIVHYNCFLGRNSVVRDWSVLLPGTILGHDSSIGIGCIVNAGVNVAGDTDIGDVCYLGSGSVLRDHISVAEGTLIGMGSVVVTSVTETYTSIYGFPARKSN
jgi:acetyltransferase-like isoleucine patch superfamily enzyme